MVDRGGSSRLANNRLSTAKSRKSSSSSEFDEEYRERLEGKYLGNGLEIRPPSGTNHQQPGSHLSIDTRLSELSLVTSDNLTDVTSYSPVNSSHPSRRASKKTSQYRVLLEKPNCYIKSPFKQGYQVPNNGPTKVVDPSIQLKKVTQDSIDRVRQQFRRPRPPPRSSVYTPRLRKAKLKTTGRPISGSGPSIQQCQGIKGGGPIKGRPAPPKGYYDEDRSYTRSPSIRPGSPTELHRPESSIHCTSPVASVREDDSISDQIIDTSNDVINSWSRYSLDRDQSGDHLVDPQRDHLVDPQRDQGDHFLGSYYVEKCENDVNNGELHDEFISIEHPLESDCGIQDTNIRNEHQTPNEHSCYELGTDNPDKEKKSSSIKDNDGTCKPFNDAIDDNHDDSDGDGDDDIHKRTLLSSYNNYNHGSSSQGCDMLRSGINETKKNEARNGRNNRNKTNQTKDNSENIDDHSKLFISSMQKHDKNPTALEKNKSITKQSFSDGLVHIVDSTSSRNVSPLMTIHLRGRVENVEYDKTETGVEWYKNTDDYKDYRIPDYDSDGDDNLDTDRIPSAVLWENLDQLNLSMNASSDPLKDKTNFSSQARKVQSAGPHRKLKTEHSTSHDSKPPKPKQRASSGKSRTRKKAKSPEKVDKAELLRKYLSDESRKFSADLPGYFTEQFNIIQEAKKERTVNEDSKENELKALIEYKEEDIDKEKKDHYIQDAEDKKSLSVYSVEVEDPSSSGVFFTMESTSTCDIDSLSEQTEDTIGASSDTRDFSDDTGFETMPGSAHTISASMDDSLRHELKQERAKFVNHDDLEVIAKAKHLTDPRTNNYKCCPYEPLNFVINARPPPGYLFYFAYGVDMNAKRMALYLRREYKRLWGVLFGFKLCFNKKGSSSDAGGFANVELSPGSSVEGCVYTITDADLSMLDNCMGYPKHYCRVVLPIWMNNCYQPDQHGVAQYCVPAVLYVAEQQWVESGRTNRLDCTPSVSQCLKASDILTPNYVQYLNQLAAT